MQNVGGIQFDVIADTGQLLKAQQETDKAVDSISGKMRKMGASSAQVDKVTQSIDELGRTAKSSGNALSGMQRTLLGLATLTTAGSLAKMADDYRTLTERVRFATNSQEEYEIVQQRLIKSANESYRSLSEASEVFIGTSDNLRSLGFSLNESLDIADSLSFAFVKNATSAEQARNALRQYDVALNKGKVDMMGWQVINNAVPTLAKDIADSLGKTTQEVLNMGIASEITATMLNDALLKSFDSNREAAMGMATSIEDAFTKLTTNLSVFVGETNKTVGATNLVASAIDAVSENIEELATIMIAVGAGAIAKYVTQYGIMTVAKMKDAVATRASIASELQLAQANLASAQAEVARTAALVAKGGAHAKNKIAIDNEALATARLATAQKAMAATSRSFLALLGGPAGIVGLLAVAGTSLAMFARSTKDADVEVKLLGSSVSDLVAEFEKLTASQREAEIVRSQAEQAQAIRKTKEEYQALFDLMAESIPRQKTLIGQGNVQRDQLLRLSEAISKAKETGEDLLPTLQAMAKDWGIPQDVFNSWITQNGLVSDAEVNLKKTTEAVDAFAESQRNLAGDIEGASEALRQQAEIDANANKTLDQLAKSFRDSANSARDNGSAVKRATREIESLEASGAKLDEAKKKEILTDAEYIDSKKRTASATNSNVQVLRDLQKELELASLSGKELAITQAESRLTEFATQTEVQAVRDLASAIYDLNEAKKFGNTDAEIMATITGEVKPLSGGAFDDQVARYEAEAEQEQLRYDEQLERLRQARELQLLTNEEFNDLEYDLQQKHEDRMKQIQQASATVQLKAYSDAFGSIADVLKNAQGEQSSIYKAMFAVSKAFAISEATINAYNAISKAWASAPFPANLGAVAMTTPAVMGVVSAVSGVGYGGGRQYGGAVSPDKMYRINETGESEVFDAGGGKQFFIPGTNGNIIPANKVNYGNGGGNNVTINLIEDASRGGQVEQTSDDTSQYIDIFVANIRDGGEASQMLESTYGLSRKGN